MAQPIAPPIDSDGRRVLKDERRVFVRYPSSQPAPCEARAMNESFRCRWARIYNASLGGIGLLLPRSFERGVPFTILAQSTTHGLLYELQARVAQSSRLDDGNWLVGCEFFIPLRQEQLDALLS
jgi:hypothetical protein